MKKYEYRVLDVAAKGFLGGKVDSAALAEKLNELGETGWEVVGMEDLNRSEGRSGDIIIILKREK